MRIPIRDPFVKQVFQSAADAYQMTPVIRISSPGSGPIYLFKIFKSPCVSVGCTDMYTNIHSLNEFARIDLLYKAFVCIYNIINTFTEYKNDNKLLHPFKISYR
jgi:acetylornithine deacetylase/succinyl-diaminopimelate desuccinylase-like protein